jgi:hypothetical protein
MSINPVFGSTELQPEDLERLELAYKYALRSLSLVDRNDDVTRIVAEKRSARSSAIRGRFARSWSCGSALRWVPGRLMPRRLDPHARPVS